VPSSARTTRRLGARLQLAEYVAGVLAADRAILSQAITLIESDLPADAELGMQLLDALIPHIAKSRRLGISGAPGVGKSTFIDALGIHITRGLGERVAVLSVDPSSPISRGSILGDKTRMARLAADERAFIRPSPAAGQLGGVARRTREAILLCEAAGYRNIFIETVGVGQSETTVHAICDFFLLLVLPGAGDELQMIKRGIMEMIDGIVVNKADGDNRAQAERARAEYAAALHLLPGYGGWTRRVALCSSLEATGIPEIWQMMLDHEAQLESSGRSAERRALGNLQWMRELISGGLSEIFNSAPSVSELTPQLEDDVRRGRTTPHAASRRLLKAFQSGR